MGSRSAAQLRSGEHRYGDFPSLLCPSPAAPRRAQGQGSLAPRELGLFPQEGDRSRDWAFRREREIRRDFLWTTGKP